MHEFDLRKELDKIYHDLKSGKISIDKTKEFMMVIKAMLDITVLQMTYDINTKTIINMPKIPFLEIPDDQKESREKINEKNQQYYKNNFLRIQEERKILPDYYIAKLLKTPVNEIRHYSEVMDMKRTMILIKREIKRQS